MNKITKKQNTEIATQNTSRGIDENISAEDLLLPRLELTQAMSPAVVSGEAKPGTFLNSIDKTDLGKELSIIPIILRKNFIRWIPRDEGGGMLWRTDNPNDPRVLEETKFGPNGEKPLATAYLNYFCILEGETMPIVVSFSNTSYTAGRKLLTTAKMNGGDLFGRKYVLTADSKTNNKGTFFIMGVKDGGLVSKEDYEVAESLYEAFSTKEIKFEAENTAIKPQAQKGAEY